MQTEAKEKSLPEGISPERRKRINRLKKMIVFSIAAAILIPTVLCIFLAIQLGSVSEELRLLREQNAIINTNTEETQNNPLDSVEEDVTEDKEGTEPEQDIETSDSQTRKVYLTFDDGPSIYTDEILDILSLYEVKATFFVVGQEDEALWPMYQRIVEEGHSIGMHSYSHKYTDIYASLDNFKADTEKIQNYIFDRTGVECSLYRFPGGSSNSIGKEHMQEFIAYLDEEGITYYDWNVTSKDATGVTLTIDELVENSTLELEKYNSAYILLHDSSTKYSTVQALPRIIEKILAMENTEIVPITENSVPVQQIKKE